MSFLTPLAFLGALIAIPIILLYMLRLRRREVMISSTFLWQQILQDREANTPWQRLRRNILLILQLIILALLVLALTRPFITVPALSGGQTTLLIDASASMNATDINGEARLEAAKREALNIVNTLGSGNSMTVVRVGQVPEVVISSSDRILLQDAIRRVAPGLGDADWLAALTLAAAGGQGIEDYTIVIIGDGGLDEANNLPTISLPGDVRFVQIGASNENVAITALATRTLAGSAPQLFGQMVNYGNQDAEVILSLRVDGESVPTVSERYTIPANGSLPVVSTRVLDENFSTLQANITVSVNSQAQDYLTEDNSAWAVSQGSSERRALLFTEGNLFLEQVFRSLPGLELFRIEPDRPVPQQPYDLYIFDGVLPDTLPDGDMLIINPPRSTPLFTVGSLSENSGNIRVVSDDDRMAFVDFEDVNVLQFRQISGADWAEPLVTSDGGPLLLAGENAGRQIAVIPFDLSESDLPLQITFPVLMSNLLEWFTPGSVLTSSDNVNVGDSISISPPLEATSARVIKPDGEVRTLDIQRSTVIYTDTEIPGIYTLEILSGDEVINTQPFAVNFFLPEESDITPREVTIGGTVVSAQVEEEEGQLEFWPIIALLGLLFLLIEWYVYHRRLQIPTLLGRRGFRRNLRTAPGA